MNVHTEPSPPPLNGLDTPRPINTRVPRWRLAAGIILGVIAAVPLASVDASGDALRKVAPPARQAQRVESPAAAQTSRVPYQAYLAADCPGGNFCRFISEVVPSSQRLEINRVACQGWTINATMLPSFVTIANLTTGAGAFVQRIDFLEARYAPANGGSVWAISEQTLMFIPAGFKLRIDVNSGNTEAGSYGCTLSGYLVTL
jgi:hypothetical protein